MMTNSSPLQNFFLLFTFGLFFLNILGLRGKRYYSMIWKEDEVPIKCKHMFDKTAARHFCRICNIRSYRSMNRTTNPCNVEIRKEKREGSKKKKKFSFIKGFHSKLFEAIKKKSSLGNVSYNRIRRNEKASKLHYMNKEWVFDCKSKKETHPKIGNERGRENYVNHSLEQNEQMNKKNYLENEDYFLRKYMDKINEFIDIETYRVTYGTEIYDDILQLYIRREIPINYEQKYFSENVKKSVVFQLNEYDDVEFQKLMEEEFIKNGIFVENIDKDYYNKKNLTRIQKILSYLPLLKLINNPSDLKKLKKKYIPLLIYELKVFIFFMINITGGHFSATLGLAELQVLLLYIFNQPHDDVIYDVGHQTYIHKILTGRKYLFLSLRMKDGLNGFFASSESIYDTFITGHSSNSLSAIQGFFEADRQLQEWGFKNEEERTDNEKKKKEQTASDELDKSPNSDKFYIAVIGDGGMTGGMALEALNYISFLNSKVLIIYNDNGEISLPTNTWSISGNKPIGSIAEHMSDITKHKKTENVKKGNALTTESKKHSEKNFFQNLNYQYIGPVDGNNVDELYQELIKIKNNKIHKSTVLHIITKKSNKYIDQRSPISKWHSISANTIFPFDVSWIDEKIVEGNMTNKESGEKKTESKSDSIFDSPHEKKTMTKVYTEEMMKYLEKDKSIVMVSPATFDGTGIVDIGNKFPKNVYDVGIAEQHAVTFSTAMAKNTKLKVFLNIYSTFLQRGYDQVIHDLILQKIPLKVIIARSGLINGDGVTHQGIYDFTMLGALNGATIISPSNQVDLKKALRFAYFDKERTLFIRIPKGGIFKDAYLKEYMNIQPDEEAGEETGEEAGEVVTVEKERGKYNMDSFFNKARIIQMAGSNTDNKVGYEKNTSTGNKKKVVILNIGYLIYNVIAAVKELEKEKEISDMFSFSIVDMIFLNPFDKNIVDYIIKENKHQFLITYEDNTFGGFATHLNNYLIENNYITKYQLHVHNVYLPTEPIKHASVSEQCKFAKMDKDSIIKRVKRMLNDSLCRN